MSDVNLQKPALSGAGKSRGPFDRSDLFGFAIVGTIFAVVIGFSDNPTVDEWVSSQWAGKCAAYGGHLFTVSDVEVGGNYATVTVLGGTEHERVAMAKLTRTDCPAAPPQEDLQTPAPIIMPPPTVAQTPETAAAVDGFAERQKEISRLKSDLEIAKLKLEIARVSKAYYEAVTSSGSEGGNAMDAQETSGAEMSDHERRLDRLRMDIERARIARDYYNRLDQSPDGNATQ
jgi:hypothetical protein